MNVAPIVGRIGSLVDHAHAYADAGLEVFPVNPRDKTPYVSQYKATTRHTQLDTWWNQYPDALIGHRLSDDQIITDVDPKHHGNRTWQSLKAEIGALPVTRVHLSGRNDGGGHLWWQMPSDKVTISRLDAWAERHGVGHEITDKTGKRVRWSCGIDLLHHTHRYTILPPSLHPDTGQPYRWVDGRGIQIPPAPMPQLLVDLIVDDEPPLPPPVAAPRDPDSIADWYSANSSWNDILPRHGWTLRGGDGDSDGARWRHPTATSKFSATVRYGCLFVYSPNTPFEPTVPGAPNGYTRFTAWALLDHGGDKSHAASIARRTKDGHSPNGHDLSWIPQNVDPETGEVTGPSATGTAPTRPLDAPRIEDGFWEARAHLDHIRQAAHARQRSADACLHVVLARLAAITPHTIELPAIVGAVAPLSYFTVIVAPPGVGKSSANAIGAEILPAPEWVADQLPLGSGEGLAEVLFDIVEEHDDKGKVHKVKRQVRHNAYVYADEGQTLAEIGNRKGATLLPTLRTIWTGGVIGQTNSSTERRRIVPGRSYVYGFVAALQPTRAGALLDDIDAGTPQRFGWVSATDPTIPDTPPDWPGRLGWRTPPSITGGATLDVSAEIADEVRADDLARARGQIVTDPLDAHSVLYRLKVAGLLAILDERRDINLEDWELAGIVKDASDAVRTNVIATVAYEAQQDEQRTSIRLARRAVEADAAVEKRRIVDCARKIKNKVDAEPDRWTRIALYRAMRRQRDVFDEAIEHAVAEGWVSERIEPGQGDDKRTIHPGSDRG